MATGLSVDDKNPLDHSWSGRVRFQGRDLSALSGALQARLTGFIPQHFQLCWNQKGAELLELTAEISFSPGEAFQKAVTNHGLVDFLTPPRDSFSGGERGRILLALVPGW